MNLHVTSKQGIVIEDVNLDMLSLIAVEVYQIFIYLYPYIAINLICLYMKKNC